MRRFYLAVVTPCSLAAFAGFAACTHRTPADTTSAGCNGRRDVVIDNHWSEPIEVFTRIGASPNQFFIGDVRAGERASFRLPDGARYAYVHRVGETSPQASMPAASQDLIDVRYLCE